MRILPDVESTSECPIYYTLLAIPLLCRNAGGEPIFSLTLVLDRFPPPAEEDVTPLIQSGVLGFEVTLAVPEEIRRELGVEGTEYRPLFVREARFELKSGWLSNGQTLTHVEANGSTIRGALSARLDRAACLDVLQALEGASAGLRLRCPMSFRVSGTATQLRLSGSWAAVYDYLRPRVESEGVLDFAELREHFRGMLEAGVLLAEGIAVANVDAGLSGTSGDLFRGFLRTSVILLRRTTPGLPLDDPRNQFRLSEQRPHPAFTLDYTVEGSAPLMRSEVVEVGLGEVLGGALEGRDRSRFIQLVCASPGSGSEGPVTAPRRLRTGGEVGGARALSKLQLSALDGRVQTMSQAMRPSTLPLSSGPLLHSDLIEPSVSQAASGRLTSHWWLDDVILVGIGDEVLENLPVVDQPLASFWQDRADNRQYWYAPQIELVKPVANAAAELSPFLFTYRRIGVTEEGKPALVGTVRITLQKKMSDTTRAALAPLGSVQAKPVPTMNLAVLLSIPYVDERDGKLRRTELAARVTQNNDTITATVDLLNDTLRLCYGAVAVAGFQSEPARVEVTYAFEAYVPLERNSAEVVAGGKIALTAIAATPEQSVALEGRPHFDASSMAFRSGVAELRLMREAPRTALKLLERASRSGRSVMARMPLMINAAGITTQSHAVVAAQPHLATVAVQPEATVVTAHATPAAAALVAQPIVIARPPIAASVAIAQLIQTTQYGRRSLVRQERLDALVPCDGLGELYQEETDTGPQAVGCVDALRLGQTVVRQYSEMLQLADPRYRVFRSLQQPGRFLVLPARYQITRYSAAVPGKAYRPSIVVYASLDSANAANNRVIYLATLQPDIPVTARRQLWLRLTEEAREPVLEMPTEIEAEVEYAWSVGSTIKVEPRVVKTPDSFQVTLATDLAGALLLKTMVQTNGVLGSAFFKLPDGTSLQTTLEFDLNKITGPWTTGPVEVVLAGNRATLTNRIERPVDVSDLLVYGSTAAGERVSVETTLALGASLTVPLPAQVIEAYGVYSIPPGTAVVLEEIRSFVEDIHTNVLFVDLVNYANHGLQRLEIQVQLKGMPGTRDVMMQGDPPRGSVDFILPLTTYLANPVLQFRVRKIFHSVPEESTPWLEWNLEGAGNVVSLSWELIRAVS